MKQEEVIDLLEFININYPDFKVNDKVTKMWYDELQQYDIEDVKDNLRSFMSNEYYQKEPPKLALLTKDLVKKYEKVHLDNVETRCPRCNRPLSLEDYDKHFDRCSSIDYVIRETKKWFRKELTRKFLWEMSEEEFNERYNKLLHYIYEHTDNESERTRIGFIFNPPSKEKAKSFLEENRI